MMTASARETFDGEFAGSQEPPIECNTMDVHVESGKGGKRAADLSKKIPIRRDAYNLRTRKVNASQYTHAKAKANKKEIESRIKFSRDEKHLGLEMGNGGFLKALDIAEHFLNLDSAKAAFSKHNVDFSLLIKKAENVYFKDTKSPLQNATNWIRLTKLQVIYLSDVFLDKLKRLTSKQDAQRETKSVIFGLAMAIVHAFGHLALEWQSKASKDDAFDSIIDSVVELGLFGKSLGLVCLNKENKTWSSELPIAGIALDSCTHQDHLCSNCKANNCSNEKYCRSKDHKKNACAVCKKPERYRLMSESFIEMVYDRLDQVTDEYLKDRSNFETKTAPSEDQSVFNLHQENDVIPWKPKDSVISVMWCGTYYFTALEAEKRKLELEKLERKLKKVH